MTRQPSISRPLARKVASFLKEQALIGSTGPLLVGVSGGPDSTCLVHVLAQLRKPLGFELQAAHLDHQLRGEESAGDAAFVSALCRTLDVPLTLESADVMGYRKRHRLSVEEAARACRFTLFAEKAAELHAAAVLLGHTANDQAETVLLHLLRGAGLQGLKGMAQVSRMDVPGYRPLTLARPLLATWRWQTEAYCAEQGLTPRVDSSNLVPEFTRNQVRLDLLPQLRRINPSVEESLVRLAQNAGEAVDFLSGEATRVRERVARPIPQGLAMDRKQIVGLPAGLAGEVLRQAVREVRGTLEGITSTHIRKMLAAAAGPTGKAIRLPEGLVFTVDYHELFLGKAGDASAAPPPLPSQPVALQVPGQTDLAGWRISAEVLSRSQLGRRDERPETLPSPLVAHLDGALARRSLWVRSRQPGDRFQPFGMPAAKKLQDFMVDEKIARPLRDHVPLVCDAEGILWVVGHRLGERARVHPQSDTVLRLEFGTRLSA